MEKPAIVKRILIETDSMLIGSRGMWFKENDFCLSLGLGCKLWDGMNENTDWDIMLKEGKTKRRYLEALGFKSKGGEYVYGDRYTSGVYEGVFDGVTVQVLLKREYSLCRHVWRNLDINYFKQYIWKSNPCRNLETEDDLSDFKEDVKLHLAALEDMAAPFYLYKEEEYL